MKEFTHLEYFFSHVRKDDIMVTRPRVEHSHNSCGRFSHAYLALLWLQHDVGYWLVFPMSRMSSFNATLRDFLCDVGRRWPAFFYSQCRFCQVRLADIILCNLEVFKCFRYFFFCWSNKCVYPSCFMLSVLDQACQTGGPEIVSVQCVSMLSELCVSVFPVSLSALLAIVFGLATSFDLKYRSSSGQLYKNMNVSRNYVPWGGAPPNYYIKQYIKNVYTVYKSIVACRGLKGVIKERCN